MYQLSNILLEFVSQGNEYSGLQFPEDSFHFTAHVYQLLLDLILFQLQAPAPFLAHFNCGIRYQQIAVTKFAERYWKIFV